MGIDAIADRDLRFAMAPKATATSTLGKSETQQSISGLNQGTKRWRRLNVGTKEKITEVEVVVVPILMVKEANESTTTRSR